MRNIVEGDEMSNQYTELPQAVRCAMITAGNNKSKVMELVERYGFGDVKTSEILRLMERPKKERKATGELMRVLGG
jgi:hypothetical protein